MSHRITRLPGNVAELVDRVPDPDIAACTYFLAITVTSAVDIGDHPELSTALSELRERGVVAPSHRLQVGSLLAQQEQRAFAAARRGDHDAHERAFFRARALNCVVHAVGAGSSTPRPPRDTLREAAYEAAIACRGPAAVESVLIRYAG
ncbi:hypothetical protein [Gordonia insulae]|uniref:Uncharacterized protein n=1 Tax=Gordonia insulae TaxID=2420509 RepID=A0A3G8JHF3_9ACTN|nr:hypothetical protein [Gordonia insulae]AZG44025.1 hypothetical protein D7316_00605 [Gordonia insulae]